jgi:hypothetical protein
MQTLMVMTVMETAHFFTPSPTAKIKIAKYLLQAGFSRVEECNKGGNLLSLFEERVAYML